MRRKACYDRYGGRGITFDPRWTRFGAFYEDMGASHRPGMCIHRLDNDGDYTKANCVWMPRAEHARLHGDRLKRKEKAT